ncbi:MAG: hypothetical protein IKQ06_03755 [Bacilli bacterium]|nr:hypothetical protein [Bacilli bacterium]
MDIEYKGEKKHSIYDYLLYIIANKKKIKEKPMTRVRSYILNTILSSMLALFVLIFGLYLLYSATNDVEIIEIISDVVVYFFVLIFLFLLHFYYQYKLAVKEGQGIIKIDKEGITDISEDGSLFFPYEKIEFILLFNDYAFIIHKNSILNMALMNYDKKKLLEALNKYNKDLLVIQQSTRR